MESIKIKFVEIFTKLESLEIDEKNKGRYILLKRIYQKINMNDNLLIKLNTELHNNEETLYKLKIFNQTTFKDLYNTMNQEDKDFIINKFEEIKSDITKTLFGVVQNKNEEHECSEDCEHNHSMFSPENMLNSKKMQKILNNKKLRYNLEHQLRKSTGMKNASLEEILKSNIPKEQQKMIDSILSNKTVKKISETFLNEENLLKVRNLFLNLLEQDEIKQELDKFRCIINEDQLIESVTEIYTEFQKTQDLKDIERLVKENTKLHEILQKLENALKNNIIDIEKLKVLLEKVFFDFIKEVKKLDLIKESDIRDLKNLGNQFTMIKDFVGNFTGDKKEKLSIEDRKNNESKRREKARKKYRRELRNKLKKDKKKNRGGSV